MAYENLRDVLRNAGSCSFTNPSCYTAKPNAIERLLTLVGGGTDALGFDLLGSQLFTRLGDRPRDGLVQVLQNAKLTDLMRQFVLDNSNGVGHKGERSMVFPLTANCRACKPS